MGRIQEEALLHSWLSTFCGSSPRNHLHGGSSTEQLLRLPCPEEAKNRHFYHFFLGKKDRPVGLGNQKIVIKEDATRPIENPTYAHGHANHASSSLSSGFGSGRDTSSGHFT